MESNIVELDEKKMGDYFKTLEKELSNLDKLNKSNTDRSLDSIQAQQYGAWVLGEIPNLLAKIKAFQNNVGFYETYLARLNDNAGK